MKVEERAVDTDGMQQIARIVSNVPESDGNKGSIYAAVDGIHLKVIDLPFAHDKVQVSFTNENIKFWKHDAGGEWRVIKTYTADDDTGWIVVTGGIEGVVLKYRRRDGVVCINFEVYPLVAMQGNEHDLYTLPEGFRPSINVSGALASVQTQKVCDITVFSHGIIRLYPRGVTVSQQYPLHGSICYPI